MNSTHYLELSPDVPFDGCYILVGGIPIQINGEFQDGDILVIGWGTTRGSIAEAVHSCQDQGLKVGGMCFRIMYPLPLMLKDIMSKWKRVVTVESAYGDPLKKPPLAMLLRSETLNDVQCIICHATGRPISPISIESKIKDVLDGKHV